MYYSFFFRFLVAQLGSESILLDGRQIKKKKAYDGTSFHEPSSIIYQTLKTFLEHGS